MRCSLDAAYCAYPFSRLIMLNSDEKQKYFFNDGDWIGELIYNLKIY